MTGDRIKGADLARVVACLMVFLHHLVFSVHASALPSVLRFVLVGFEKGKFGVSVFFVLSGFLLGLPFWKRCDDGRTFQVRKYVVMRLARIVPAAWFCFAISIAVDILYLGHGNGYTLIRLISGMAFISDWHWLTIFPVDSNGPLWSLSFEISAYVFMPVAFVLCRRVVPGEMRGWAGRYVWSLVILAALLLHAAASGFLPATDVATAARYGVGATAANWFPSYNAFGFFAMFAIGTLAAGVHTLVPAGSNMTSVTKGMLVITAGALLPALVFAATAGRAGFVKPPFAFPAIPIAAALFLYAAQHVPLGRVIDNQLVAFAAKISFGIYIWHVLILIFVTDALRSVSMSETARLCLIGVLAMGFTSMIAWLSYRFFEEPILERARLRTKSATFSRAESVLVTQPANSNRKTAL